MWVAGLLSVWGFQAGQHSQIGNIDVLTPKCWPVDAKTVSEQRIYSCPALPAGPNCGVEHNGVEVTTDEYRGNKTN